MVVTIARRDGRPRAEGECDEYQREEREPRPERDQRKTEVR